MRASPLFTGLRRVFSWRVGFVCAWLLIVSGAAWTRFADLSNRPMHFDEATGARLLGDRLAGDYAFDPRHFHGPMLGQAAAVLALARGESHWNELTIPTLRWLTAAASLVTLLAAGLFWCQRPAAALAAMALVATSPLLVFYGRMFIHESLLGLWSLLALVSTLWWLRRPTILPAVAIGLAGGAMLATKETAVLTFLAWGFGMSLLALEKRKMFFVRLHQFGFARFAESTAVVVGTALILVMASYSEGFSRPQGLVDFFATFFFYETTAGHEKPALFYLAQQLWPTVHGRIVWTEAGVTLLALIGFLASAKTEHGWCARFLGYAALAHVAIYSLIAYKTPWLLLVPWLHVCLLAGYGVERLVAMRPLRVPALALLALVFSWQSLQAARAAFRFHSSAHNPYAYVATSPDVEQMAEWLYELQERFPEAREAPLAVAGKSYWPLPWYLRKFEEAGYFATLPADAERFAFVIALPGEAKAASVALAQTHVALPRGLRLDTPVLLFIRQDIWAAYRSDGA